MKRVRETSTASESSPEDFISKMPKNVITNILDRLPLQYAVRTSILSTNWRFNWTLLSKLVFDYEFFKYLRLKNGGKDYGKIISRLLLNLKGVITTFSLYVSDESQLDGDDINHWLLFLSSKGIREFVFINFDETPPKLPSHLFSCLELKQLTLYNCSFHPPPSFRGFPNLLRLHLTEVIFQTSYECGEFLSHCPLLEFLSFRNRTLFNDEPRCEVKLIDISKLKNLKTLDLSLCLLDDMTLINVSSICHHISLLPKLQELTLFCWRETLDIKRISTVFPSLKFLNLMQINLSSDIMVSFAFGIIFSSPNLKDLIISARYANDFPLAVICSTKVDNNTMGPLQLRNVVLFFIIGLDNEVYLIKSILACSPMLKKIVIKDSSCDDDKEMYELASKMLKLHRASPQAVIDF